MTKVIYSVMKGIYPPKYSVVRLIGDNGGYEHIKSFKGKKEAASYVEYLDTLDNFEEKINKGTQKSPFGLGS